MTDKIKEAREAFIKLIRGGGNIGKDGKDDGGHKYLHGELLVDDYQTILKALSAYEKLQGVDLDGMKEKFITVNNITPYTRGYKIGYNQAIDDIKAQLVADIGGK